MATKSTKRSSMTTKNCAKICNKKCTENIHSIYNQEFRFPSIITRIKNLLLRLVS